MKKALHSFINNIFAVKRKFYEGFLRIPEERSDLYQKSKPFNYEKIFIQGLRFLFVVILGVIGSEFLFGILEAKTINLDVTSSFLYYLCSAAIVFLGIALFSKIFIHCYRISIKQIELYVLVSTFYLNSRLNDVYFIGVNKNSGATVQYHEKFIDFLIIIFGIFIFGSVLNYFWPKFSKAKNFYLEDNPLDGTAPSETEKRLIEKLNFALLNDKYEKSFSIGVIGTWGIGKSSFMKHLLNEIQEQQKKYPFIEDKYLSKTPNGNIIGAQRTEVIEFSPFLNHNDDNVINEFFLALSNVLNKYSGKLSSAVKEYAEQLTNFIDDNKVVSVINLSNNSNNNNISVDEHYNEVNRLLAELELKVIVFIDDLDRLNPQEILQVLKLIRNTSNFKNFVFVVAMDKEYVVNSLRDLGEYTGRNYIDKFFQLECFLPEIEHSKLVELTIKNIQDVDIISAIDMPILLKVVSKELHLLPEYIRNYREVKRFVNHIHFEYNNVKNLFKEVSIKDYLNLMFLKTNFPQYYRALILNYRFLLQEKNGILSLKKNNSEGDARIDINMFISELDSEKYYAPDTSMYDFGFIDSELNQKSTSKTIYSIEDIKLIKKTMFEIFQHQNNPPPNSLCRVSNLNKVAYWRIAKGDLSVDVYTGLITYYIRTNKLNVHDNNLQKLRTIIDSNKIDELITRLSFEALVSKEVIHSVVRVCFDLLSLFNENQQSFSSRVEEILASIYNKKDHFERANAIFEQYSEPLMRLFKSNYLNNTNISFQDKVSLINQLKSEEAMTDLWGYTWMSLIEIEIQLLEQELSGYDKDNWRPNDYKVFGYFFFLNEQLREASDPELKKRFEEVKLLIIDFFKNKEFNILFFNLLNPEHSSHFAYRLNNIVLLLFDSIDDFISFLEENYSTELRRSDQKVKTFLRLMSIVQNQRDVKMDFPNEYILGNFNEWGKFSETDRERMKQSIQVFVKCNLKSTNFKFSSDEINFHHDIFYSNETVYWYFASNQNQTSESEFKQWILESFKSNIKIDHDLTTSVENGMKLIDSEGNIAAEIISIE